MMLSVFVLAFANGKKPARTLPASTTPWVSPWEMELIEVDDGCPQLCGNLTALYLSDSGCTGGDKKGTGEKLRFCPDIESVDVWTVENEEDYETMYLLRDELLLPERKIFKRKTLERTLKLSVHPWQKFRIRDVRQLLEKRRIQASSTTMRCVGPKTGGRNKHYGDERPEKISLQFQLNNGERVISHIDMKYPTGLLIGGDFDDDATTLKKKLPDCVTVVFVTSDEEHINGINFLSQGKETRLLGDDINESFVFVAPSGYCLGDMRIRYDEFINRICFRFNSESD